MDESHAGPTSARLVGNGPWLRTLGSRGPGAGRLSCSLGVCEGVEPQWLRGLSWSEQRSRALAPPRPVPPRSPTSGAQPLAPHSAGPSLLVPAATQTCHVYSAWLSLVPASLHPSGCVPGPAAMVPRWGLSSPPLVPVPSFCPPIPPPHDGQGQFLRTHIRSSRFLTNRKPTRCP